MWNAVAVVDPRKRSWQASLCQQVVRERVIAGCKLNALPMKRSCSSPRSLAPRQLIDPFICVIRS
eukprot:5218019-Pleurochrysis_carterae.AAC.2